MTSNDAQMDVLLRRFAGQSQGGSAAEHMDADELAAFAEGSLPEAARTRYVSHLVDCDNCRQVVSQLAISSGSVMAAEATTPVEASGASWWKGLAAFLSPTTLRYAAFAIVLITVAGVVYLVTRRPQEPNLVAQTDQQQSAPQNAVKPYGDGTSPNAGELQSEANNNKTLETKPTPQSQPSPKTDEIARLEQPRSADSAVSPPKPAKEGEVTGGPGQVASKRAEPAEIASAPSYAPPPPAAVARAQVQTGQQQNSGGFSSTSGPRKSGPADQFKTTDKASRVGDLSKDNTRADDNSLLAVSRPASSKRAGDEKVKGPRRDLDNNVLMSRNANDVQARSAQGVVAPSRPREEKAPETRSAGGRKFRRQGNAWVDAKFKSSMPLKSISRGSSEFGALDSGLRSIAQQLGGEVIVVWKNKAYLIK